MQKSGQITSVIDFLIEQNKTDVPITRSLSSWFKQRRFIGSKDRRNIKKILWGVIRNYAKISFFLQAQEITKKNAHLWVSCYLILAENADVQSLELELYNNSKYALESLSAEDKSTLESIHQESINQDSLNLEENIHVNLEVPKWVYTRLLAHEDIMDKVEIHKLLADLKIENSTYIRTNTLQTSKKELMEELAGEQIIPTDMEDSPYSNTSLKILGNYQLTHMQAYKNGLFDIQDHNSQLISALIPVNSEDIIIDYCAGAGGKSLALASIMENSGKIFAHDMEDDRLKRLIPRLKRAKTKNIEIVFHDDFHKKIKTQADILVLDVPCSGSGTWKRTPYEKWKLTPDDLLDFHKTQLNILENTKDLINENGQIVYITCSIFAEENEMIIKEFLNDNPSFKVNALDELENINTTHIPMLSTPYGSRILSHKTAGDSFFISILKEY